MVITRKEMVETEVVEKTVCDCCGSEIKYDEGISVKHSGGYYSLYPGDNKTVEFDICDLCLKSVIKKMTINARIK